MPPQIPKTRSIFFFLGVTETGTDASIELLQERLGMVSAVSEYPIKIERKGDLIMLKLVNPDFCFYVTLVNNDNESLTNWSEAAKNFELPWDKRPVTDLRLKNVYNFLDGSGKAEYRLYQTIGFSILRELEKFCSLKVFTIPSAEKRGLWRRIFSA